MKGHEVMISRHLGMSLAMKEFMIEKGECFAPLCPELIRAVIQVKIMEIHIFPKSSHNEANFTCKFVLCGRNDVQKDKAFFFNQINFDTHPLVSLP